MIDKNAYLGGCDGVSTTLSAHMMGQEPVGTMPHALILIMGDAVEALKAFNEIIPKDVARVALIDTFNDEKFEALDLARALGKDLMAIRFDTPRSRRGNFRQIIREVRWELDLRGFQDIKIFVSGGIDEDDIISLGPIVDSFGVGTAISNAPVLDFSMDIVEIEGEPVAKRGKMSGAKDVYRCSRCGSDQMAAAGRAITPCSCGGQWEPLLGVLVDKGEILKQEPRPEQIRNYVLEQLKQVVPG
jgi:nicotinate phosphoribosyltransferase